MKQLLVVAACIVASGAVIARAQTVAGPFVPTAFSVKVSGAGRPVIFIPGFASPDSVWDGTVAHWGGGLGRFLLQRQMHPLVPAVLFRMAGFDSLIEPPEWLGRISG